ncbi:MAG: hypothetical protein K0B06_01290 [Brevefilum sp.]|nr:hypothetical protein [Brevefilum sp.]
MDEKTQPWEKPQLIIMAKGEPEESVLTHCKTMNPNRPQTGPTDLVYQDTCAGGPDYDSCTNCQSRAVNAT